MSHGTDYQRYKHKLDRLQSKVKRSENARKELEIRLQRLMKERNECEKSASIHKSKYNTLLKHERTRLNRNEELLEMLEDVQTKAANLASNTERLKILKNQQERILINNWRRNACLQQHIFYPNVIYPSTVQYVLPPPPQPPPPLLTAQPAVISSSLSHDYQNSTLNSSIPSAKPLISVHGKAPYFVDNAHEAHSSTSIQSFIDTANVGTHQQQPTISQLSSSLMPIYHSEPPFHPLYNNNFYIRSHEPQQLSYQEAAFLPNRINKDVTKSEHIGHEQSEHDKNSNSIQFYESLAASRIDRRPMDNSQFPLRLNKSQQQYGHQYYSPAIEPLNRTINQFSLDDGSTSSQINVPSNASTMVREFTHLSNPINESQQHGKNKSNTEPSIYDDGNVTDMFAKQMSGEREVISNPNTNSNDIDSMYQYERNINDKCNEPFKRDPNNDVYANDNEFEPTSHIESADLRKSISNTYTTSMSNVTPSTTAATATKTTMSPSKYVTGFALNENAQHIPYSAASTSTFDDVSNERDSYPYENISDRTYTSFHPNESNVDNIEREHINDGDKRLTAERISTHTLFPSENQQKITKRRSSIDADSFAKTLGHDTNLERESIAANIRRRYSVAANFLNLPSTAANDMKSFNFTPTISTTEYHNNTRAWVNNNKNLPSHTNTIEPDHIDSIRTHDNGMNNRSPFDTNSMSRIDDNNNNGNGSAVIVGQNQIDMPLASSVSHTLPIDSNDGYLHQLSDIGPSQHNDENINQYDNGNATPAYTTAPYTMDDDQTYVENAMEQLKLDDNSEHIQFDDSADRIRASGKTVTWADDPDSNYKKQNKANIYEAQNMANNVDSSADPYYANQTDTQQQQQQQHIQQHDYVITDGNGIAAGTNESPHYQYDSGNQYDNGQYQYHAPDAVAGTNDDYYYGTEQINQYDQYAAQPEAQPQQQEDAQQMQYYTTDATEINDGSVNDGYQQQQQQQQQFQTETTLQVQPKQDEYYTVSPGENYYTDYENVNETHTYAVPSNAVNSHAVNVTSVEQQIQKQPQKQQQQQQQQHQSQPLTNLPTQHEPIHVPNYLHSDTDDSQTGYQSQTANAAPQSQDSDFDFSINS